MLLIASIVGYSILVDAPEDDDKISGTDYQRNGLLYEILQELRLIRELLEYLVELIEG
jgi:hypothetical protein